MRLSLIPYFFALTASRPLFIQYRPLPSDILPLTMCIDSYCLDEISRDIQGHAVGVEWDTNNTNITVHIPPRDFFILLDPQIDCYILTEDRKHIEEPACIVHRIPFDWNPIFCPVRRFFDRIGSILIDAYPYMIILVLSVGIAVFLSPSPRAKNPIGVVRIGYFSRSVEFHHLLPHPNISRRLSDENIMKQMLSDPDISSIRISLITQKSF